MYAWLACRNPRGNNVHPSVRMRPVLIRSEVQSPPNLYLESEQCTIELGKSHKLDRTRGKRDDSASGKGSFAFNPETYNLHFPVRRWFPSL